MKTSTIAREMGISEATVMEAADYLKIRVDVVAGIGYVNAADAAEIKALVS